MRLSLFVPSMDAGGAERVMLTLASGFAGRGYGVDLVLAKAEGPYLAEVPATVRVVDLKARRVLSSLPALARYLRRERPAAMLSALSHANVVALWAGRLAGTKTRLVVSDHNAFSRDLETPIIRRQKLMPTAARLFYPWADGIVAVSDGVADDLSAVARLRREDVATIHNPVALPGLPGEVREAPVEPTPFAQDGIPVVLSVGRLTVEKDLPTLIRAFSRVRAARPARLLILGEGAERPRLEALTRELGLDGDVSMPGFATNPYAHMRRSSVLALSSMWEGFGVVLVEAMACGCPVVSTDCPSGPSEILAGGRYGPLVPVGDEEALARAILRTLDAPPDPEQSRARAGDFSVDAAVDRYLEVLLG